MRKWKKISEKIIHSKYRKLIAKEFIEIIEIPLKKFRQFLKRGNSSTKIAGYLGLDYLGLL
ncbi:MAG TPA: hypothetical protein VJB90_01430 [Candidatus Nanoarchaeia archaeon]|nr:hypothetical protein [Candidatus Nanoarchaeia archaeon]